MFIGEKPERRKVMCELSSNKRGLLLLVIALVVAGVNIRSHAAIAITKAKMEEQVSPYDEKTYGYADADLTVYFKGNATCNCGCEDLSYEWHFGDGDSSIGNNASHVYGTNGAGNRSPYLNVVCAGCFDDEDSDYLTVWAIDDIRVDLIGDITNPTTDGRLCFNSELHVAGTALPAGVNGSGKIDWYVMGGFGADGVQLPNTSNGTLPDLDDADWPTSNSDWGEETLSIDIDGPLVSGQQGELRLTGTVSYIENDKIIDKFYEAEGKQHPDGYDPWDIKIKNNCYYYSKTSAHNGCIFNHNGSYCEAVNNPDYPPYVGLLDNPYEIGDYTWQGYGFVNGDSELWGIDVYAYASRHEMKHHDDYTSWWGPGGVISALDQDESYGDNIPDSDEPDFTYSQGGPYDPEKLRTRTGTGISGFDDQIECMFTQDEWNVGSLESSDWAHAGSQWH